MKKSLIALAILGSVAGVAQAQSTVTLYGLVDVYLGRTTTEVVGVSKTNTTVLNSGGLNGSRFGLKGEEDLGGGLKAIFKLEQGFNADTGTQARPGTAFGRQAYVGLAGGFGEVQFGHVWSALDDVYGLPNSAFDSIFSPGNSVHSLTAYNDRPQNAIRYTSPSFGGLTGAVSYGLKEAGVGSQTDFNLTYAAGPLTAALAYEVLKDAAAPGDVKFTMLAGTYDLGVAKLLAGYNTTRNVTAAKTNEYQIGVDFPLSSALTLSGGFASSEDKVTGGEKRTGYSVAATYSLSKRTTTYIGYRTAKAKTGGNTTDKDSIFATGIRHTF